MANELHYGIGSIASAPAAVSPGVTLVRGVSRMVAPTVSSGGRLTYSGVTMPTTTATDAYFWIEVPSGGSLVSIASSQGAFGFGEQNWVRVAADQDVYVFHERLLAGISEQMNVVVAAAAAPSNRPPIVDNPIPNQVMVVGTPKTFNLETVFEDPDADTLTYAAASSAPGLLSASVSGHILTLTPVAVGGPVTVTVTATDTHSDAVTMDVAIDVHAAAVPNRSPVAVGTIPDQTATVGTEQSFSAVGYFSDPDRNIAHWSAASSDASLVRVLSVMAGVVTYSAVGVGSAVVTVTATDADGLSASQAMNVAVRAAVQPTVDHQPVVVVPIADQQMVEGQGRTFNNISGHFSDLDGDAVSVSITKVTDRYACNAVLQGNALVLEAGNVGTSVIYLRGTDATTNRSVGMSFQVEVFEDESAEHPIAPEGITDFITKDWVGLREFIIYVTDISFENDDQITDDMLREYGLAYFSAKRYIDDYAPLAPQEEKNQCLVRFGAALNRASFVPDGNAFLPDDLFVSSGSEAILKRYRLPGASS